MTDRSFCFHRDLAHMRPGETLAQYLDRVRARTTSAEFDGLMNLLRDVTRPEP